MSCRRPGSERGNAGGRPGSASQQVSNKISAVLAQLPVSVPDPATRLALLHDQMDDLKSTRQAVGAELLTQLFGFAAPTFRARPGAQVSTPIAWAELDDVHPDQFTLASLPERLDSVGDPWIGINDQPQSLEPLLEMSAADRASGLLDAPWPPVYPKMPDEPPRVAPSRAKKP